MTKSELENKHLSDLHLLAAEAGVEKYRMLTKSELVERLAEGNGNGAASESRSAESGAAADERKERPRR
ncbi:MAG TPA: Rho termination factor N-terminal domain-containing protein, partial [Solirubrobacterales bacterium]